MQIEGAFVQGIGWVALEELKWGDAAHKWIPPGCLLTCGPGNYKIPSINDVPLKFNVSLLKVNIYCLCFILCRLDILFPFQNICYFSRSREYEMILFHIYPYLVELKQLYRNFHWNY